MSLAGSSNEHKEPFKNSGTKPGEDQLKSSALVKES